MTVTHAFYLARADECARDAAAATLDNVRERNLRSEAVWRSMAASAERTDASRAARAALAGTAA